jgi:hypothetical protein
MGGYGLVHVAQDGVQLRAVLSAVMSLRIP